MPKGHKTIRKIDRLRDQINDSRRLEVDDDIYVGIRIARLIFQRTKYTSTLDF